MEQQNQGARRTEDIALDLLKFVASHANVGSKQAGSTAGFGVGSSTKPEDQVAHLLELYGRCREAVEGQATPPPPPPAASGKAK